MTQTDELKKRIIQKGNELIELGKIPLKNVDEWLASEIEEEKGKNPLIRTELGWLSNIAHRYGVTINPEPDEDAGITFLKIADLATRLDTKDNMTIGLRGRVMGGIISRIPKKEKDTGERIKGEFKEVARIEIADETGSCSYQQWEYISEDRNVFEDMFNDVKSGAMTGKTIVLKKIKPERSSYTGHEVSIKVLNGGRVDFEEEEMKFEPRKYQTTSIKSVLGSKESYFFLLKVSFEPKIGEGKRGAYQIIPVVDTEGMFAKVNLWYPESDQVKIAVGDILLVEGQIIEEEYQGKMYKKINHWRKGENTLAINPDGYEFAKKKKELKNKTLANAEIDEYIQTTVIIKRFFKKKPYYLACPVIVDFEKDRKCGKGVKLEGKEWKCNGKHTLTDEEANNSDRIIVMSGELADEITMPFTIFDRGHQQFADGTEKESLMAKITALDNEDAGRNKDELLEEYDTIGEELFYERLNQEIGARWFKINAFVELDEYKGRPSLRIEDIVPVNADDEIETIKARLIAPV